jgi:DNA polymerase III subunit delta
VLYVYFGADDFACSEALRALEHGYWDDPTLTDLNRTVLDGRRIALSELHHHCDAIPFLAKRRLVIVEGLVTRLDGKSADGASQSDADQTPAESAKGVLEQLLAYLPQLPETTDLVLLDPGLEGRNSRGRIVKWASNQGERAKVKEFPAKKGEELADWVKQRIAAAGGHIEPRATAALIQSVGDDMRAMAQEIDKLTLYADVGQAITAADVQKLVPHSADANVFLIVDQISQGQPMKAIAELRRLLEDGVHPLAILSTMTGQFRAIVQIKALAAERISSDEMARRLGWHPYRTKMALAQANRFQEAQLRTIYDRLVDTELAIKTGQQDAPMALELFVLGCASDR